MRTTEENNKLVNELAERILPALLVNGNMPLGAEPKGENKWDIDAYIAAAQKIARQAIYKRL